MKRSIFMLSLLIIIVCFGSQVPIGVMTAAPQPVSQGICVGIFGDSVQIARLGVERSNTLNRLNIEMRIANASGSDLTGVAWAITSDDGQANSGYVNIPRCGLAKVSLSWPILSGSHTFTGDVDPLNSLRESPSGFSNNHQAFVYTPTPIATDTQELDYEKARLAGALFVDNRTMAVNSCAKLGQEDAQLSRNYSAGEPGVVFIADCPSAASFFGIQASTGGTADPEVFRDFHLKNGWKVKSVTFEFTTNRENQSNLSNTLEMAQSNGERQQQAEGFRVITSPEIGSGEPHTQVHIAVRPGFFLKVYLKIIIEGPVGTDPFGVTSQPCESGYIRVTTPSGPGCALAEDVATCTSPIHFRCSVNGDCYNGNICPTSCNRCLRGHVP